MSIKPNRRRAILAAHGGVCHYCGSGDATHVDHIVPKADGGTDDLGNLIAACLPCNLHKFRHRLPPDAERRAIDAAEAMRDRVLCLYSPHHRSRKMVGFGFRVSGEWLELVDDLRRQEKDIPTRAEYLRRLAIRERQRQQTAA